MCVVDNHFTFNWLSAFKAVAGRCYHCPMDKPASELGGKVGVSNRRYLFLHLAGGHVTCHTPHTCPPSPARPHPSTYPNPPLPTGARWRQTSCTLFVTRSTKISLCSESCGQITRTSTLLPFRRVWRPCRFAATANGYVNISILCSPLV